MTTGRLMPVGCTKSGLGEDWSAARFALGAPYMAKRGHGAVVAHMSLVVARSATFERRIVVTGPDELSYIGRWNVDPQSRIITHSFLAQR